MEQAWPPIADAARWLGVSPVTLHRVVHEGTIPCSKVGRAYRIGHADLDAYVAAHQVESGTLNHLNPPWFGRSRARLVGAPSSAAVVEDRRRHDVSRTMCFLATNPARGAKRPRVEAEPVVPFTAEEVKQLRAAALPCMRVALTLGLACGLRMPKRPG